MQVVDENILDLCIYQGIEDSKNYLDILYLELKLLKNQIEFLDQDKPFWFQKKKLEIYNKEREELENKLNNYHEKILYELSLIAKLDN